MKERRKELAEALGRLVAGLRHDRGWSQEKLARMMEMSRETVRAIESGKSLPDLPTLEVVAKAFDMGLGDLIASLERVTLE
jgi:putative transcriptional regulator